MELNTNDLPFIHGTTPIADICYPRKSMPALFVAGCNFRCPYCINNNLVTGPLPESINPVVPLTKYFIAQESWLMVSGAEPLSNPKTPNLLAKIKMMGMNVALATNGSYPNELAAVCDSRLVDYVAMDIKTALDPVRYSAVSGTEIDDEKIADIVKSIEVLRARNNLNGLKCEYRMTACRKFVTKEDAMEVAALVGIPSIFVLQMYTTHQTMDKSMANDSYIIPYEELVSWVEEIDPLVGKAMVREV